MRKVVFIENHRKAKGFQPHPPQPAQGKAKKRGHYFINAHLEYAAVRQFTLGDSVTTVANRAAVTERTVEQALRDRIALRRAA